MEAEQYQRVKEIFQSVVEAPADQRSRLLDEKCGHDLSTRAEVERLLASFDTEFMEQPAVSEIANLIVPVELEKGRELGRYTILGIIGKGGMGEVYLAEDARLSREVALKILPEAFAADADRRNRFEQEAKAASALNHPNILTIFEFAEEDGSHFIVSEYVSGVTLRRKIGDGTLSVGESLDIAAQVAAALDAAHGNGIVHRDIKPENIMVRDDGLVKVLDFGLAKLLEKKSVPVNNDATTEKHFRTAPGMIMGTVEYMSPEQTRGQPTDARTDIWSLGCVLYEMLAGRSPFEADNTADLIAEIVKTHPPPLAGRGVKVPKQLQEIISKCLKKDAGDRYQSVKDLSLDLKPLKLGFEVKDGRPPNIISTRKGPQDLTTVSSAEYLIWGVKAHRMTAIGITLFVLSLLGGTALLVRQYWRDPVKAPINEARFAYANKIKLAAQAIETSNLPLARQLLEELKPKKGEEDLRSFEWGYLSRLHAERVASQPMTLERAGAQGVAFSPDGRSFATAGTDGNVRIWDVATGEEKRKYSGHTGWIWSVAFSSHKNILVSGGADKTIRMWDASGQEMFVLGGEDNPVETPVFAPDGRSFAAINGDRIRFWNAATGEEISGAVKAAGGDMLFAYSPDGKYLCVRGPEFTSLIIDRSRDKIVSTLKGHSGFWTDAKFSPDSQFVVTANTDGTAKLWDVKSGRDLRTFRGHTGAIYDVAFSPDGNTIATGSADNSIKFWDREKGYDIATLKGHTGPVTALVFSPDGLKLVSAGDDNTSRIWNVPTKEARGVFRGHNTSVVSIVFSRDNKLLASAGDDKTARIWDAATEVEKLSITGSLVKVNSVSFSPDGRTLMTADHDGIVKLWDAVTGRERMRFDSLKEGALAFFSGDSKTIATGHFFNDPDVRLWDAASGKLRCSFRLSESGAWDIAFAQDGKTLTASGMDNLIGLWDTATCAAKWTYEGDPNQRLFAMFDPTDRLIGIEVLNNGRSLRLFDAKAGSEIASIGGHDSNIESAKLSPDGKRLITGHADSGIKIWDVATGQELLSITANIGPIESISFSPNRLTLAAGGGNGTIKLWHAVE